MQEVLFDPKSMPQAIDNVLGNQLAFTVKVIPNSNYCYSIVELSEDSKMIN